MVFPLLLTPKKVDHSKRMWIVMQLIRLQSRTGFLFQDSMIWQICWQDP